MRWPNPPSATATVCHIYNEELPLKRSGPDYYQASAKAIVVDIKQESDGRFSGQWTLKVARAAVPTPVPVECQVQPPGGRRLSELI